MAEEYQKYVAELKDKISKLKQRSKQWWKLNREILRRKTECFSIPPLRQEGSWVEDSKQKPDLFAQTFRERAELPPEVVDTLYFGRPDEEYDQFIPIKTSCVAKLFKTLNESKASGPDRILVIYGNEPSHNVRAAPPKARQFPAPAISNSNVGIVNNIRHHKRGCRSKLAKLRRGRG